MLNKDLVTIGSLLKSKFSKMAEGPHLKEALVIAQWNKIIPKEVRANVKSIRLVDDALHIKFDSAIVRHTMKLNKAKILEQLAANHCGYKVEDLVLF